MHMVIGSRFAGPGAGCPELSFRTRSTSHPDASDVTFLSACPVPDLQWAAFHLQRTGVCIRNIGRAWQRLWCAMSSFSVPFLCKTALRCVVFPITAAFCVVARVSDGMPSVSLIPGVDRQLVCAHRPGVNRCIAQACTKNDMSYYWTLGL